MPTLLAAIGLWPDDTEAKGFRERGLLEFVTEMVQRGSIIERRPDGPCEVVLFEYSDRSGAAVVGVAKLKSNGRAMEMGMLCPTFRPVVRMRGMTIRWQVESKLRGLGVVRFPLVDQSREPAPETLPAALRHLRPGWVPMAVELDDTRLLDSLRGVRRPVTDSQEADVAMTGFVESMSVWSSAADFLGESTSQSGSATFEDCLLNWYDDQVGFAYPMGLRTQPSEPRLQVRGVVLAGERRMNTVSGWPFDWAVLETSFGNLEVVIPALDPTPIPGQVLLVNCRLVGRMLL